MKSVHALCSLQKSWVQKYCALYNNSRHGVKRLEIYDSEETFSRHAQRKILTLEDCIKVVPALQKHQTNVFEVSILTPGEGGGVHIRIYFCSFLLRFKPGLKICNFQPTLLAR